MNQVPSTPRSFASVNEAQSSVDVPKPPPGPPPVSPPRVDLNQGSSTIPPPPPPLPPVPPMPVFGDDDSGELKGGYVGEGLNRNGIGENPNESLRTCDLPRLSDNTSALEFGDWLSVVDSHMGDLSYSSGVWWSMVKGAVEVCYKEWLLKSPVERIRLKPKLEGQAHLWPRTERRALSMLLQAVPDHVREDVISGRKLTPDQVLFRLYCLFQPGGASERTKLLQVIADCQSGDTVREVLGWVRNWRRYVGRAKELGITLPDALVLVGVLQQGSEVLSRKSPQVAYRLNMIRQQLSLDQRPNLISVMTYAEHLQAEAEELALVGSDDTEKERPPKPGNKPVVKALDGSGTGGNGPGSETGKGTGRFDVSTGGSVGGAGSPGVCRFWGSDEGCKRGDRCKFTHSLLNPKDNRCFGCSAVGHNKKDCPILNNPKKKLAKSKSGDVGNRRDGTNARSGGTGGLQERANDGNDKPPKPPGISDDDLGSKGVGKGPGKTPKSDEGVGGNDQMDRMLQEATALMKSLRPKVKTLNLSKASTGELTTGLLDGGATNALRQGSLEELGKAMEVSVELAAGSIKLFQCIETGTLLSPERVEPIVPLRGLIALGYKIRWDERGCLIFHPQRGRIRCWLRNGCPVVTESHALGLISDIEAHERFRRMGPRLASGRLTDEEVEWWHKKFPLVPQRVLDLWVRTNLRPTERICRGIVGLGNGLSELKGWWSIFMLVEEVLVRSGKRNGLQGLKLLLLISRKTPEWIFTRNQHGVTFVILRKHVPSLPSSGDPLVELWVDYGLTCLDLHLFEAVGGRVVSVWKIWVGRINWKRMGIRHWCWNS